MGREKTLLERFAAASFGRNERTSIEGVDALMESVRDNLQRLLNSRHGLSQALPEYGLPALGDLTMSGGNHVNVVRDAIQAAIERFEPRLRRVRVLPVQEEGDAKRQKLTFRIEANLISRTGDHRVWYETALTGAGEFDVAG